MGNKSVNQVAGECLDSVNGDWEAAAKAFSDRLDDEPGLREALVAPLIGGAIWQAIRHAAHNQRYAMVNGNGPETGGKDDSSGLELVARRQAESLLDYPLAGGKRLGDATRTDLETTIAWHQTLAEQNSKKACWFEAIMKHLGAEEGVSVKDVLDDAGLQKLLDKAKKSKAA